MREENSQAVRPLTEQGHSGTIGREDEEMEDIEIDEEIMRRDVMRNVEKR